MKELIAYENVVRTVKKGQHIYVGYNGEELLRTPSFEEEWTFSHVFIYKIGNEDGKKGYCAEILDNG